MINMKQNISIHTHYLTTDKTHFRLFQPLKFYLVNSLTLVLVKMEHILHCLKEQVTVYAPK